MINIQMYFRLTIYIYFNKILLKSRNLFSFFVERFTQMNIQVFPDILRMLKPSFERKG